LTPEQAARQEAVIADYRAMYDLPFRLFLAERDALQAWADWSNGIRTAAHAYEHDAVQAIAERIVLSACRGDWGRIDADTMGAALALATFFLAHARKAMQTWDTAGADMSTMQKVLACIYANPGITPGLLHQKLNLPKHKRDACLRELAARGAVTTEEFEFRPGRTTTRYSAVVGRLTVK
jgi:hypothetical protein